MLAAAKSMPFFFCCGLLTTTRLIDNERLAKIWREAEE
jgi:hypothetical protein